LTPFGKGERAIEFEDLAAAKMAFLVKMVVDRSVDRNELLERFRTPEFRHRTLSPATQQYVARRRAKRNPGRR